MKVLITPTGKLADNDSSRGYLRKLLAERITETSESSYYSDDMARGHMLEPLARDYYSKHKMLVIECGFITKDYESYCIGYSPDGLVGDDGLIVKHSTSIGNNVITSHSFLGDMVLF